MTANPLTLFAAEAPCAGTVCSTGAARSDLALAMGLCEAGQRATALVSGADLPRCTDLLQDAAARLLPLVVRVNLSDGDAGLHAIADSGAVVLVATQSDELAALHLAARLLAERALLPVVLAGAPLGAEPAPLPPAAVQLLGDASDFVTPPTPVQTMLFGATRRRVPRWFDLERPVLRGQDADAQMLSLQRAGLCAFVQEPAAEVVVPALHDAGKACGRELEVVQGTLIEKAEVLVIALGSTAAAAASGGATSKKPRIGVLALRCLRPFPQALAESARGRTVVVLERADTPLAGDPPLLREVRASLAAAQEAARHAGRPWKDKELPRLHGALVGLGGAPLVVADLLAFCAEVAKGGRALVHLGIEFAGQHGLLPKRRVLHEALRRARPGIETLGLSTAAAGARAPVVPTPVRAQVPTSLESSHDSLVRFWDVLGSVEAAQARDELGPDPYLTAGSVPALTSQCRPTPAPAQLPAFDPSLCTGCGRCWTACPDGAILPAALLPAELLEFGMQRAKAAGHDVDALRQIGARLGKELANSLEGTAAPTAGAALRKATATVTSKLEADRKEALGRAAESVAKALDGLVVSRTEALFASAQDAGGGALLTLAIDPDACQGCNLCVAECAPQALTALACTPERASAARSAAELWRALPDTGGAVIARAKALAEPGLLGALQLSRHCLHALAPGDPGAPGDGSKIALRAVLAACEAHLQPRLQQHLHGIDELRSGFATRIRELLASALPASDLDALHEGLLTLGQGPVALSTLATRLDALAAGGRVDAPRLQRLVDTARTLADLRFRIEKAQSGLGRARAGLLLHRDPATGWAATWPWNPFAAPAVLAGSECGQRALGLMQGAAAALAQDFALVRAARALLEKGMPGPRLTGFGDLDSDERKLCPPLLVVADAATLGAGGLDQLAVILGSGLPVKVLALSDTDPKSPRSDGMLLALLALSWRSAFVFQASIADRDHLASGMLAALEHPGPALVHVHAPQPIRQGFAADQTLARAAAAVAARVHPLFCYDPALPGAFGQKLSLAGNPDPGADGAGDPQSQQNWRTLQELAGVRTPFTAEVQAAAQAATAKAHAEALASLAREHEARLHGLRTEIERELAERLQRRLTALAGGRRP